MESGRAAIILTILFILFIPISHIQQLESVGDLPLGHGAARKVALRLEVRPGTLGLPCWQIPWGLGAFIIGPFNAGTFVFTAKEGLLAPFIA